MKRLFLRALAACLMIGLVGSPVFAQITPEFSADMKSTDATGKVSSGKVFMEGNKIRQEMAENGESMTVILRFDKMVSWTLLPGGQYLEMAIPFDPARPAPDMQYETKTLGTETVNGYACQVIQYTYKEKKYGILVQWVADKLGFTVKTQTKDAGGKVASTMEYFNIVTGKQADSLFEIPAGYQKMGFPF